MATIEKKISESLFVSYRIALSEISTSTFGNYNARNSRELIVRVVVNSIQNERIFVESVTLHQIPISGYT